MSDECYFELLKAKKIVETNSVPITDSWQEYKNACREIILLNEENARLREMVRWREYPEEKPEDSKWVMTCVRDEDNNTVLVQNYLRGGEWEYGWKTTHWMPLPIPPEVNHE